MDERIDIKEKATNFEADERREVIFEMIIKGYRRAQIIRFCAEKYNIGVRQTEKYMQQVREELSERIERKKDEHLNLALIRYNDLYSKNYSIQDYRECRAVQDSINKMLGINEPERIDHTTQGKSINIISLGNGSPEATT